MTANCARCEDPLPLDGEYITCGRWKGKYHFECSTVAFSTWRKYSVATKKAWECTFCRGKEKVQEENVQTQQAKRSRSADSPKGTLNVSNSPSVQQNDNNNINRELKEIKEMPKEYVKTVDFTSTKYDKLNIALAKNNKLIKNLMQEIGEYKKQNETKDALITCLQKQINRLEQKQIDTNIEIKGVPMKNTDNVYDVVNAVGVALNININETDIEEIYAYTDRKNKQLKNISVSFSRK